MSVISQVYIAVVKVVTPPDSGGVITFSLMYRTENVHLQLLLY